MKKNTSILGSLVLGGLMLCFTSCAVENCLTCTMEGTADLEFCSDGSIIENGAQDQSVATSVAAGFSCN